MTGHLPMVTFTGQSMCKRPQFANAGEGVYYGTEQPTMVTTLPSQRPWALNFSCIISTCQKCISFSINDVCFYLYPYSSTQIFVLRLWTSKSQRVFPQIHIIICNSSKIRKNNEGNYANFYIQEWSGTEKKALFYKSRKISFSHYHFN